MLKVHDSVLWHSTCGMVRTKFKSSVGFLFPSIKGWVPYQNAGCLEVRFCEGVPGTSHDPVGPSPTYWKLISMVTRTFLKTCCCLLPVIVVCDGIS